MYKIIAIPSKKEILISREGINITVEIYVWFINGDGVEFLVDVITRRDYLNNIDLYLKDFKEGEQKAIRHELFKNNAIILTVKK